jgi:anti-sigma factor RsiW
MSGCPAFEDLSALIDGDLRSERELAVRRHLDLCATCRREVDGLTALKRAVGRAYDNEVPAPALRRAVMARLPKRRRRRVS